MTGPESGDAKVIRALKAEGSDLSKPHYVDFFFLLPGEFEATGLAQELRLRGMKVDVNPPDDDVASWSCTGWQWLSLDLGRMEALTEELSASLVGTTATTTGGALRS